MTFSEAIKVCFIQKYFKREGRARRSEYWYFNLFNILVGFGISAVLIALDTPESIDNSVSRLVNFIFLAPSISVAVRRLHDVNKSGWWYLINFTIIGIVYFIYLMAKEGDHGTNQYGPDPKGDINDDNNVAEDRKNEIEKMGGDSVI